MPLLPSVVRDFHVATQEHLGRVSSLDLALPRPLPRLHASFLPTHLCSDRDFADVSSGQKVSTACAVHRKRPQEIGLT
jgi:hypothetical protein